MTSGIDKPDDDATRIKPRDIDSDSDKTRIAPGPSTPTESPDATRIAPQPASTPIDNDATVISPAQTEPARAHEDDKTRISVAPVAREGKRKVFRTGSLIRDRFRLETEIGRGGMGVVYTARDLRKEEAGDQDSLIAIKLLSEDFKRHPDALRMLQQETRKTQTLAHPNVVTVYDFDRDGDTVYMTMEYLTGMPLTDYIQEHADGAESLQDVLPMISDIVHGLQYAHDKGIIHSDLKPGNVFLVEEGTTKIVDFGIARAIMGSAIAGARQSAVEPSSTDTQGSSTQQSETLFALTPKYASPEMFDDAAPDPRDDIYALACITYELLTGSHPFSGLPANEAKNKGLAPQSIPGLSDRQWKGLVKGLAFEREERSASAEEFLGSFLPKRKQPWKWATLGVGILAVASAVYFVTRPPQEAPLSDAERTQVNEEIEVARLHMQVGSLGNALENYKMILALPPYDKEPPGGGFIQHPFNRVAMEDLEKLLDLLGQEAESAIDQGRWNEAKAFIKAGLDVDTKHSRLLRLAEKIEQAGH